METNSVTVNRPVRAAYLVAGVLLLVPGMVLANTGHEAIGIGMCLGTAALAVGEEVNIRLDRRRTRSHWL
jgi:hypothetical protein